MQKFSNNNEKLPLSKFELMLKTNAVYFFDSHEFEEIILYYIDNGKISLAKKALVFGLTQYPVSIALKLLNVELLLVDDKLDQAEKILDELQLIEPSNDEVYIQKSLLYSKKRNHQKAIESLQTALLFAEDETEILSMIGMEYLYLDDFENARKHFEKGATLSVEDYSSLYNVIYCYEMQEKHIEAANFLKKYIDENPYSEIAWHQLGRQYYILGNYQEALESFDYSIIIDESFIGAYLEKAKTLERLNKHEEAIVYYQKTIALDDPTSFAYLRIGKCFEKLNKPKQALAYYNKTINEDPLLDKGWLALAEVFIKKNDFHKALYYINKALSIDEENYLYWHLFAQINLNLNMFEEAVRAYYRCLTLQEDKLDVYVALADVLLYLGDYHEAIQVLLDARETYKDNIDISYRLAGLHFLIKKDSEGFFFLEKSLKSNLDYQKEMKKIFPNVFAKKEVDFLVQKYIYNS